MSSNLIVARLDHQQSWFVLLYTNIKGRQAAAMFLSSVEEDRLVHGDSHWQPSPQCKQLQYIFSSSKFTK